MAAKKRDFDRTTEHRSRIYVYVEEVRMHRSMETLLLVVGLAMAIANAMLRALARHAGETAVRALDLADRYASR